MGGSICRKSALAGVCALAFVFCEGTAGAASTARVGAGPEDDVVVIPRDFRDTHPFTLRFADTEGAEHVIDLAAARFATDRLVTLSGKRTFREPDLSTFPATNVRQSFAPGKRDLFIVQANDPAAQTVVRRWLERVRIPILGYVPREAYLVRLDPRQLSLLSAQEAVFWIGLFQPAYRVAPDLDYIQQADPGHRLKLRLRLDLETFPTEDGVRAMLGSVADAVVVDVARTHRDWIVRVDGPVELARAFAARPGVMWVERFVDFRLDNKTARTSVDVPTGRGAVPGPIMDVEAVWGHGIHGEGQIAGASDTGLSTGDITTPNSMHWDFGQVGSATNPMRVIKGYALGRANNWNDNQTIGGGHGTHTSGSIVGNGVRSGSDPGGDAFTTGYAGVAPKAEFVFQSIMNNTGGLVLPADLNTLFQQAYNPPDASHPEGARVHSNSWGAAVGGQYTTNSENLDEFVWNHQDMVITFSAGNSGLDGTSWNGSTCAPTGAPIDGVVDADSIGSPGTAKNCITVGASENHRPNFVYQLSAGGTCSPLGADDQRTWGWGWCFTVPPLDTDKFSDNASGLAAFSSRGPTNDSRIKPDLVAPGVAVTSTRTNVNQGYEDWGECEIAAGEQPYYVNMGGTSMANPLTAGAATLVRQYYVAGWHANGTDVTRSSPVALEGFTPSAALVKATLINGAWDMAPGQYGTSLQTEIPPGWDSGHDLPNNAEGFGRVDLRNSLFPHEGWGMSAERTMLVRDVTPGLTKPGDPSLTTTYGVGHGSNPLVATLVWTDPFALAGAGAKLVNNLDLEVTSPSGKKYRVNRVDTEDAPVVPDTVNNVEQVKVTVPETGNWTISVVATSLPGNGVPGTDVQPFALVVSAISCSVPTGVATVAAAPNGNNRIDVTWTGGAPPYHVYRGTSAGAATTLVGTVAASPFVDTNVAGGITYYYVVKAATGDWCESVASDAVSATALGVCSLAPGFAGLDSVTSPGGGTCGLNLAWAAATAPCGGAVSYSVYRSTSSGFVPGLGNRIAAGLSATSFTDASALASGTPYYYVVRATDEGNGVQDTNTVQGSGTPTGAPGTQTLYGETFDDAGTADGALPPGWAVGSLNVFDTVDWRGVQPCTAHSSPRILRFGGTACTGNNARYEANKHSLAHTPGIPVPGGSTNVTLSFWHRYYFQGSGNDGGYLRISLDGSTYSVVPASAITAGLYNGTTSNGLAAWNGSFLTSFTNTVVNLDAACNAVAGNTGGCAGKTAYVAFAAYTNGTGNVDGWFVDDVQVTASAPGSCSAPPEPVPFLTARSTSGTNLLEWQNPANPPYGSALVLYRTDGTFPTSPTDPAAAQLTCPSDPTLNAHNSCTHDSLLNDGTTYSYSLFSDNGLGVFSSARTVAAKPFDTTGAHKWAYATGAASLAPAGILPGALGAGAVFGVSNDRVLHAMNSTSGGGSWPRTAPFAWTPAAMNGPAQHRPPVVPLAAGPRVFLASQDGHAYAFDAETGAELWDSGALGSVLQANPAGFFSDLVPGAPDMLFVGTRNATSGNKLVALDPATGATLASFDNGGGGSAIGIVTGITVDYATSNVYFTSRANGTGSPNTLWCVHASTSAPYLTPVSSVNLGDIDGGPVLYNNTIYVGTNGGLVRAINVTDPANPVLPGWSFNAGDGPVKGYVTPRFGSSPVRLYFATNTTVWAVDEGAGAAAWSVATVTNPSTPLYVTSRSSLLVGGGDGTLYELGAANGSVASSLPLGTGALGSPARDATNELFHVGSTAGVVHAVTLPLQ